MQCNPYRRALALGVPAAAGLCLAPGLAAGWWPLTRLLLVVLLFALWVPNLWVHLVRRVCVHHAGDVRYIWIHFQMGEADLRHALSQAFPTRDGVEGVAAAMIEGLESPRGSGVIFPLALVANNIVAPLTDDCNLALLRPVAEKVRFAWKELLEPSASATSQYFRQCVAANGYALVSLPEELMAAPRCIFGEAQKFFGQSSATKRSCRHAGKIEGSGGGVGNGDLRHGWFAEGAREFFEVHRRIGGASGQNQSLGLPYPTSTFETAACATFETCEAIARRSLELLLDGGGLASSTMDDELDSHKAVANSSLNSDEEAGLLHSGLTSWMHKTEILNCLFDDVSELGSQDNKIDVTLSTSCFRVHQYNAGKRLSGSRAIISALHLAAWSCFRCLTKLFPPLAACMSLVRGLPNADLHADLGLISVSPKSTLAGLLIYSRGRWKLAEAEMEDNDVIVFAGHALGWLGHGAYRPLLHGVRAVAQRRSLVFFLRPHAGASLYRPRRADGTGGCEDISAGQLSRGFHHLRTARKIKVILLRGVYWCSIAAQTWWRDIDANYRAQFKNRLAGRSRP